MMCWHSDESPLPRIPPRVNVGSCSSRKQKKYPRLWFCAAAMCLWGGEKWPFWGYFLARRLLSKVREEGRGGPGGGRRRPTPANGNGFDFHNSDSVAIFCRFWPFSGLGFDEKPCADPTALTHLGGGGWPPSLMSVFKAALGSREKYQIKGGFPPF